MYRNPHRYRCGKYTSAPINPRFSDRPKTGLSAPPSDHVRPRPATLQIRQGTTQRKAGDTRPENPRRNTPESPYFGLQMGKSRKYSQLRAPTEKATHRPPMKPAGFAEDRLEQSPADIKHRQTRGKAASCPFATGKPLHQGNSVSEWGGGKPDCRCLALTKLKPQGELGSGCSQQEFCQGAQLRSRHEHAGLRSGLSSKAGSRWKGQATGASEP